MRDLLDSLLDQSLPPDEVVICDGGSTDNTLIILNEYKQWLPLKIVSAPGSNISTGRNTAIAAAAGPIIAATDAGVTLSPRWLEAITRPLRAGESAVVSGWFEGDPFTDFEVVMSATVLPAVEDVNPDTFLPSSRSVAFLKSAWEAVHGYPEWLDYSEDLVFDRALRQLHGPFPFVEQATAYFRPTRQPALILQAVLQLRPRRRQGAPMAFASRHPLRDLFPGAAIHPAPHLAREMGGVAAAGRRNRSLRAPPRRTAVARYLGLAPARPPAEHSR